jgi:hypothetical protein
LAALDQSRRSLRCLILLLCKGVVPCSLLQPDFLFKSRKFGRGVFLPRAGVPPPGARATIVILKPSGWDAVELELVAALALAVSTEESQ